jgi:hypothetical protein
MVALVSSGEADIGIGGFSATVERSHVVELIDTVEFSRQVILIYFNLRSLILICKLFVLQPSGSPNFVS